MKECRVIIINEESGELLKNELIDEELADQITGIIEDGEVDNYEECEQVCSQVEKMLDEAGISTENHDEMIEELKDMKLVKKHLYENVETPEKIRKTKEKKVKGIKEKGKELKIKRNLKIKGKIRTVNDCICD